MTGTISGSSPAGRGGQGRRRARQPVPRTRMVEFTLTGEEYAILAEAAGRAGMARRAYAAQAALAAAANGTTVSGQDPLELLLIELMRAAGWSAASPPTSTRQPPSSTPPGSPRETCPAMPPTAYAAPTTSTP